MSSVFLVTEGSYSDYRVVAVCSTLEKANRAKELTSSDNDIEEIELDLVTNTVPEGYQPYYVTMAWDGAVFNVYPTQLHRFPLHVPYLAHHPTTPVHYVFPVIARDEVAAIKITNEKRAQLIANNLWFNTRDEWMSWERKQRMNKK